MLFIRAVQRPRLMDDGLDRLMFSDQVRHSDPFVVVSRVEGRKLKFNAGRTQGLTVGSRYRIHPPGSHRLLPDPTLPWAVIVEVEADHAVAHLDSGRVSAFSRAVEMEHVYPSAAFGLHISEGVDVALAGQIQERLVRDPVFQMVKRDEPCHAWLEQDAGRILLWIQGLPRVAPAASLPVDGALTPAALQDHLMTWVHWFNVLSLDQPGARLNVVFEIHGDRSLGFRGVADAERSFLLGDAVVLRVWNHGPYPVFPTLLVLSSDGTVAQTYPGVGGDQRLEPGTYVDIIRHAWLPEGMASSTDVIKLFATMAPLDLKLLTTGATRRGHAEVDFNRIKAALSGGSGLRSGSAGVNASWTTMERVVRVFRDAIDLEPSGP